MVCQLHTKNICHRRTNFSPFCSTTSRFLRNKVVKNWKYTEWPQDDLAHLTVKKKESTLYTLNVCSRVPNFKPICCTSIHSFSWQGCRKPEMHWMTSDWPWTPNWQRCPCIHWTFTHQRPKCWSVSLYNQPFLRYKVVENWKCTRLPQTVIEQVTVKRTVKGGAVPGAIH